MKIPDQQCDHELRILGQAFFHRKVGFMPGLVCDDCNSLYDWPEHSFLKAVEEASKEAKKE